MCKFCEHKEETILSESIDCKYCSNLKIVSGKFPNLMRIHNMPWPNIEVFSGDFGEVERMNCSVMENLQKFSGNFPSLEALDFSDCKFLTEISGNFPKLEKLECGGCTELQILPEMCNLKYLELRSSKVQEISGNFPHLEYLCCIDCSMLKKISGNFPKLTRVFCSGCTILLQFSGNFPESMLDNSYYGGCPFLNYPKNYKYSKNIHNLSILQKFVRKYQRYRKFVRYTNSREFIEWIYDPDRIGGRISKNIIHHFSSKCIQNAGEL